VIEAGRDRDQVAGETAMRASARVGGDKSHSDATRTNHRHANFSGTLVLDGIPFSEAIGTDQPGRTVCRANFAATAKHLRREKKHCLAAQGTRSEPAANSARRRPPPRDERGTSTASTSAVGIGLQQGNVSGDKMIA